MAVLSQLPPAGLIMELSPDTAHAADDIKKQLEYVDQDRDVQEAAAAVRGKWHSSFTKRSRRRCRLVSRSARTRRSNCRKSRGSPANLGGEGSDKDARDTRKTTAGLNTQYKVRVPRTNEAIQLQKRMKRHKNHSKYTV